MKNIAEQTLSGIALANHAYIPVLEKYSLDFCCRGKRTLQDVCTEKNIPLDHVVEDLNNIMSETRSKMPFTEMDIEQLITYIIIHHHFYVRNSMNTIFQHIQKVAIKHADRYPHMPKVLALFTEVMAELLPHLEKEEKILFPRIKQLAETGINRPVNNFPAGYLEAPIHMMEAEHDTAGQLLFEIRELTNEYRAPEDACTTHRVCLTELRAFEEDLHQHVHLENNILFPKALALVAEIKSV